jgi:ATP-dependent Clp protease ATP-binding subunit ClpA
MVDLGVYKNKFTESGLRVLVCAIDEARYRNQNCVCLSHILKALTVEVPASLNEFRESWSTLHESLANPGAIEEKLEKLIESRPHYHGEGVRIAPTTRKLFQQAMKRAQAEGRDKIEASDLMALFIPLPYIRPAQN